MTYETVDGLITVGGNRTKGKGARELKVQEELSER